MKSMTKFSVPDDTIRQLFQEKGLGEVTAVTPLTAGEFNSAYSVTANGRKCVLKIAPQQNNKHTLTYETDLMRQEVAFYKLIRENTDVRVPEIYCADFSESLIPAHWFVMEKLQGVPLTDASLSNAEKARVYEEIGAMLAKLHTVTGKDFGYVQNGLCKNWYLAVRKMIENLLKDCKAVGKRCRLGERLLSAVERHKTLLETVPCTYVHFDVWEGNVFYQPDKDGGFSLALIDTERSLWGDRLGDFCSLDFSKPLSEKTALFKGYNRASAHPIHATPEEEIRYRVLCGYLGLIMYTERFYRYKRTQKKYYINAASGKKMLSDALRVLEADENS